MVKLFRCLLIKVNHVIVVITLFTKNKILAKNSELTVIYMCRTVIRFIHPNHARILKFLSGEGGPEKFFLKLSMYFTEGNTGLPREAIGPEGSNSFLRGSILVFLWKPIITIIHAKYLNTLTSP